MMEVNFKLAILFVVVVVVVGIEAFTDREQEAIDEFKASVIPKIPKSSYLRKYRKDDLYFFRWLKGQDMRVAAAERAFLKHLEWRERESIDTINEEDWSQFHLDFPLFMDTYDTEGRPSAEIWFTEWNTRQAVVSGQSKKLERWMTRLLEMQARKLYAARAAGSKVTDLMLLCDTEGFNVYQHACVSCLPIYAHLVTLFEDHYTGMYKNVMVTDVPWSFNIVWKVISPLMSGHTREIFKMYSSKSEWMPLLEERYDKDQRSLRFGGTLAREVGEFNEDLEQNNRGEEEGDDEEEEEEEERKLIEIVEE